MAVKTRAELKSENASDFPDNADELISPGDLRGQMDDVADSAVLPEDLTGLGLRRVTTPIASTPYVLTAADNGTVLYFTSAEAVTVTVPAGLPDSFACEFVQGGSGKVTVLGDDGVTVNAIANRNTTAEQFVVAKLLWLTADVYLLSGNLILKVDQPPGEGPVNTELPVITVNPAQAFSLSVSDGIWTNAPTDFAYQLMRDGITPISGANGNVYDLTDDDIGHTITATVTATNEFDSGSASSLPYGPIAGLAPSNTVAPTITGGSTPPKVGETVIVNPGSWTGIPIPALRPQWKNIGTAVPGATSIAYVLQDTDLGDNVTCTVTATSIAGTASVTTAAVVPVANTDVTAPVLSLFSLTPTGDATASMNVTTTKGQGVFYYVIVPTGSPAPTAAQVKAGKDGAGATAFLSNWIEIGAIDTYGQNPAGMSAGTVYDAYAAQYDAAGNASSVAHYAFTSGGSNVPVLSAATIADSCDVYVWARVTSNNGAGSLYVSCCPAAAPPPSAAQIVAGTDGAGATVPHANQALTAIGQHDLQIVGLTANTNYVAYLVQKIGASTYSNIFNLSFTSDILVARFAFDGTATGLSVSTGALPFVTGDLHQVDPDGGTNAVKLHDNNDGLTGAVVFSLIVPNYFNGINRIHYTTKWQSGSEWHRTGTANVSTNSGFTHWDVRTGVQGTPGWNAARGGTAPTILQGASGWNTFSASVNMSNVDPTVPFDGNGAYSLYISAIDNNPYTNVRNGGNVQYLYNARITRPA